MKTNTTDAMPGLLSGMLFSALTCLFVIPAHAESMSSQLEKTETPRPLTTTCADASCGPILADGFASLGDGTIGGDRSNTCLVSEATERALRRAIKCTQSDPGAQGGIVKFGSDAMDIVISRPIDLPSNISIFGPVALIGTRAQTFSIEGSKNVILNGITFRTARYNEFPGIAPNKPVNSEGYPCPDPMSPATGAIGEYGTSGCPTPIKITGQIDKTNKVIAGGRGSENIFISRNIFVNCGDKCISVHNSNNTDANGRYLGGDKITISENLFSKSMYGILVTVVNSSELRGKINWSTGNCNALLGEEDIIPTQRVTVSRNHFYQIRRRSARVAYCGSMLHQYNNIIEDYGLTYPDGSSCETSPNDRRYGFGPSSIYGARLLLEANYISRPENGCIAAVDIAGRRGRDVEDSKGYLKDAGNLYVGGARGAENMPEKVFTPPYSYALLPAQQVYEIISETVGCRSGANAWC